MGAPHRVAAYAPAAPVFGVPTGGSVSPTGEYWRQPADGQIIIGGTAWWPVPAG